MDKSKLLERWNQFKDRCPDEADVIKTVLCQLAAARGDQQMSDEQLSRLQDHISSQAQELLGINPADRQSLAAWAAAMSFIQLVKKERTFAGRHA